MSYAGIRADAKLRAAAAAEKIAMLKAKAEAKDADRRKAFLDAIAKAERATIARRAEAERKRGMVEPKPSRIKAKIRPEPAPVEAKRPKEVVVGAKPERCSAIIQFGKNRGKQCVNKAKPNSEFCGIHIRSLSGI
jgi:hypothetical protein